ncbi:hypothetical protein [Piscinibacter terrae]|nr:hypothetical protein [Albitalea terrae]
MHKELLNNKPRLLRALAASFAVLAFSGVAFAGDYRLRQTEPDVGSNIRRAIGATSIPLDRGYADLKEEEIADLRSRYESLSPTDEPPFPLYGLKPLAAAVSRMQHSLLIDGRLSLVIHVGADGVAQSVGVVDSPNDDLQAVVFRVLMDTPYKPAKCAGKPCVMDLPFMLKLNR